MGGYSTTPLWRKLGVHLREQDIRAVALPLGLVDVKVAALDDDWSGLRLVWRRERRGDPAARPKVGLSSVPFPTGEVQSTWQSIFSRSPR